METVVKKPQKRVTLRYLAKECDLSVSTVSEILRGNSCYCSEKTKKLVFDTAKALGYRPNIGYKLMRGISTKTVAITLFNAHMNDSEYIQKTITLLIQKLTLKGYFPLIITMPTEVSLRRSVINDIMERGAEFIVSIWPPCNNHDLEHIANLIPVVVMDGHDLPENVAAVNMNVEYGVGKILEHFKNEGCKHIKMILADHDAPRMNAFTKFMGLPKEDIMQHIFHLSFNETGDFHESTPEHCIEVGFNKTREILEKIAPETDAIFYFTDLYALGGAKYLQSVGRHDVKIAGYNNTTAVRCCAYPISSVGQNEEEVVNKMLEFETLKPKTINLEPEIFIRK